MTQPHTDSHGQGSSAHGHGHGACDAHGGHGEAHHGPNVKAYLGVFVALCVFTGLSFVANHFTHGDKPALTKMQSFGIILMVALAKAGLVGAIFMHLKWDWSKLYFLIIPAFILATMMMIIFLPDQVLAWRDGPGEAEAKPAEKQKP